MKKSRILVVDDDALNVEMLEEYLSVHYEIVTASNGSGALNMVEQTSPDLIILDSIMPGLNGFNVCRRLKTDEKTRSIPIIMITAFNEIQDKLKAKEAGADDFISKPTNFSDLSARVTLLLKKKAGI